MKFKKQNASIYVFLTVLVAASGISTFARVFLNWNPALYALSLAVLAVACAMQTYLYRRLKEKPHPVRDALIGGAAFFGLSFGAAFLVNNVLLGGKQAALAAFVMSIVFALAFLAGATAAQFAGTEKPASRALVPLACAVFLAAPVLQAAQPVLPERFRHPFENKITETEGTSNISVEIDVD